ncbi:hypothetical protein KHA90_11555 [Flavobacterium psychroterrae]|uniref:Uncharacterized protein n=1 Tax=Flavobacterium psychroterrae TaxID=2133767 RepID=A0ABS5PC22_9FLAO|nr:hypothetical protein [Flavobacterium psychroterrae]MBS7231661.1 hypothetical protein [Flavobacterium psychroterrae]
MNEIDKNGDVLILNIENEPLSYLDKKTYVNFIENNENHFFNNAIGYNSFIQFIKDQDVDSEEAFHFVDYVNSDNRKIVFTSANEKGRIIIKYYNEIHHFDVKINYSKSFEKFENCFKEDNQHLPKFLKNSIIDFSAKYESENRIFKLFENLNDIINAAKVNFEIYLNNLSIDKIRKDYEEYKSKYFKELSEILSNLTQKIIGFPIIIATTLFAIEKVKENFNFLILIIFIIVITNVYLVLLLKMNFKDLTYIKLICEKDYLTLKDNNFFIKQPKELEIFSVIYQRITDRIKYLRMISEAYYWILCISNTIIIVLILNYLGIDLEIVGFITLAILFIMAIFRNKILNDNENASLA